MALLHGAAECSGAHGWVLAVGHVHHGWRGREADRDAAFVAGHARRLGLPFAFRRCDARESARQLGLSPEAGARHVRYAALAEIACDLNAPLTATAHQRDDAVESHLLACERRAGLAGLAGPRERREDGVVRPLLAVTRSEILQFLEERGIAFRRDASNGDLSLDRNRVRRWLAGATDADRQAARDALDRLAAERTRLEQEYSDAIAPRLAFGPGASTADAQTLADCGDELARLALARLAAPFARPGRPPMTGREREQLIDRLGSGEDFRFESGRRIRFERRGACLTVRLRPEPAPLYDPRDESATRRLREEPAP
jgi:tRNA(Ile)-lysidine synthetase-like protein